MIQTKTDRRPCDYAPGVPLTSTKYAARQSRCEHRLRTLRSSFRPRFAFFLYEMNNNWKSFCIFVPIIAKRNEYEIH